MCIDHLLLIVLSAQTSPYREKHNPHQILPVYHLQVFILQTKSYHPHDACPLIQSLCSIPFVFHCILGENHAEFWRRDGHQPSWILVQCLGITGCLKQHSELYCTSQQMGPIQNTRQCQWQRHHSNCRRPLRVVKWNWWWVYSSDTLLWPPIYNFLSFSLHCRSSNTHHANTTFHDICVITIDYTLYPLHHQPGIML